MFEISKWKIRTIEVVSVDFYDFSLNVWFWVQKNAKGHALKKEEIKSLRYRWWLKSYFFSAFVHWHWKIDRERERDEVDGCGGR